MDIEKEVKVIGLDTEKIEAILKQNGAKQIAHTRQVNYALAHEASLIESNSLLRIREESFLDQNKKKIEFTYKLREKKLGISDSKEYTVLVDDQVKLLQILELLGFTVAHKGSKERVSYEFMNARFDFDLWDKETFPERFIEIEFEDREDLKKILEYFNIPESCVTNKSIKELKEI